MKKATKYYLRKCPKFLQLRFDMGVSQIDMQQHLIYTRSLITKIIAKEPLFYFFVSLIIRPLKVTNVHRSLKS